MGKAERASLARDRPATPRKARAGPDMRQNPNHTDEPRPSGQRGLRWCDVTRALGSPKARPVVAQYGRFSLLVKLGLRKPLLFWSGLL